MVTHPFNLEVKPSQSPTSVAVPLNEAETPDHKVRLSETTEVWI